jgi:hypothetical protein
MKAEGDCAVERHVKEPCLRDSDALVIMLPMWHCCGVNTCKRFGRKCMKNTVLDKVRDVVQNLDYKQHLEPRVGLYASNPNAL